MMQEQSFFVFISYARRDGVEFINRFCDELENANIKTWVDFRDIKYGNNWDESIDNAIRGCYALIFVMTQESIKSENCQDEWSRAISYKKVILPIRFDEVEPPFRLHRRQYIDFVNNFEKAIRSTIDRLRELRSTKGRLKALQDRLLDIENMSRTENEKSRFRDEIEYINEQISEKEKAMAQPDKYGEEFREKTQLAINSDVKKFINYREFDRIQFQRRIVGNPPIGIGHSFIDRKDEFVKVVNALTTEDNTVRLVGVYGDKGVGKTALACEVMADLENDTENISGLIYLSTTIGFEISLERIYLDCVRVLEKEDEQTLIEVWRSDKLDILAKIQVLLELLANLRCIIYMDGVEEMLEQDGTFYDNQLQIFIECFLNTQHKSKILLTSSEPILFPYNLQRFVYPLVIDKGLSTLDAITFLKDLDQGGVLGFAEADPALLTEIANKTYGSPRALELVVGILTQDPLLSLENLVNDKELFKRNVIHGLVSEGYARLDNEAMRIVQALSVFRRPISSAAVCYLIELDNPVININITITHLARRRFIRIKRNTKELYLHPLDREFCYSSIPNTSSETFNRKNLELRAAEYYKNMKMPPNNWKNIIDLEPQLLEFEHLRNGEYFDKAEMVLNEIDEEFLMPWGYSYFVAFLRQKLIGKLVSDELIARNNEVIGYAFLNIGEYDRALEYLDKALAHVRKRKDKTKEAKILGSLGLIASRLGMKKKGRMYTMRSLEIFRDLEDNIGECTQLYLLGRYYYLQMCYKKAERFSLEALEMAHNINAISIEVKIHEMLGGIYQDTGKYEIAQKMYTWALSSVKKVREKWSESSLLLHLGWIYSDLGNYALAESYYLRALTIARNVKARDLENLCIGQIGIIYIALDEFEKASIWLSNALDIATEINFAPAIKQWAKTLGWLNIYRDNLYDAEKYIEIAEKYDFVWMNDRVLAAKGVVFLINGDYENAYNSFLNGMQESERILSRSSNYIYAVYNKILLLSGLALTSPYKDESDKCIQKAINTYKKAQALSSAKGISAWAIKRLKVLLLTDKYDKLQNLSALLSKQE